MRFKWLNEYWAGTFASLSLVVLSLWLALHEKLTLYIHPRYIWFTTILCGLGLLCIIADAATRQHAPRILSRLRITTVLAGIICITFCLIMITFRPTGLTSSAAGQRGINAAALTFNTNTSLTDLRSAQVDYTQFSLKEWASLLAQTDDSALFTDKPASLTGFVSPTPDNNPNIFYVSRFVMTCCAVDARPIGVPVYKPGWRANYKIDSWLEVQGSFMRNPESSANPIVLNPQTLTPTEEPNDPYAY
jgi:putative membrane protein